MIVVIGHAIQANLVDGETCFVWSELILEFQMPLLFLVSGYTAGFSFPSQNSNAFIKKKVVRLFVPYLSWAILHYFLEVILLENYRKFAVLDFLKELFVSAFWFLRMLFLFFIVMWLCDLVLHLFHIEKNKILVMGILIVSSVSMIIIGKIPLLSKSASVWYYLWFVSGYILYAVTKNGNLDAIFRNQLCRSISATISLGLMVFVVVALQKKAISPKIVTIVFTCGIPTLLWAVEQYIPQTARRRLEELGKNTLPIYAIHWCLLFSLLWEVDFYTKCFGKLSLAFSSIFTSVIWVIVSVLMVNLFRKNKVTKTLLLGEEK